MPFKNYLSLLLLIALFFTLPIQTKAQPVTYEEPTQIISSDALSWSYSYTGTPNGLIRNTDPLISYNISFKGDTPYELIMWLDGKKVDASYDSNTGKLEYQAQKLTGAHSVKIQLIVGQTTYTPAEWSFTIDANPINPYEGKDEALLRTINKEAIDRLNYYRSKLQLKPFELNEPLRMAAQAHSNYLSFNNTSGHYETAGKSGFTGVNPWDRATYFGFSGSMSEGISYARNSGSHGVDNLMDAPYHRLSIINPHHNLAGTGYNNQGDIIIKYGNLNPSVVDSDIVVYPHDGQQDAKTTWFVAENPNPLRFWNKDRIFVGYPISYSYHPVDSSGTLIIEDYAFTDEQGNLIPVYDVTPTRDDHAKNHVFLIPKEPLLAGHEYTAEINAYVKDKEGNQIDTSRIWSFKTAAALDIEQIFFSKKGTTNFINLEYNNGEDENSIITISKGDEQFVKYENGQQWTYKALLAGTYTLTVKSPLFNETKMIPITISANTKKRYDTDGDWLVTVLADEIEEPTLPSTTQRLIEIADTIQYLHPNFETLAEEMFELIDTISDSDFALLPENTVATLLEIEDKYNELKAVSFDGFKEWEPVVRNITDVKKPWTITLSQTVLDNPQSRQAIDIVDMFGKSINPEITITGNTIKVSPNAPYIAGIPYTLVVKKGLLSSNNTPIAESVYLTFILD